MCVSYDIQAFTRTINPGTHLFLATGSFVLTSIHTNSTHWFNLLQQVPCNRVHVRTQSTQVAPTSKTDDTITGMEVSVEVDKFLQREHHVMQRAFPEQNEQGRSVEQATQVGYAKPAVHVYTSPIYVHVCVIPGALI